MHKPTRVVFLDVDGPIAGYRQCIVGDDYDPSAVKLLAHLQKKHQFLFVLSSARRKITKSAQDFITDVQEQTGVTLLFHEQWRTSDGVSFHDVCLPQNHQEIAEQYAVRFKDPIDMDKLSTNGVGYRGLEILKWLQDNNVSVDDSLVIDDSSDLFPIPLKNIIYIKAGEIRGGLQVKHYDQIDKYFDRLEQKFQRPQRVKTKSPTR